MIDPFRFGHWVSKPAIKRLELDAKSAVAPEDDIEAIRVHYDGFNQEHLAEALNLYPVEIERVEIAGVATHLVSRGDCAEDPILLCLHGGAFMWGRGAGALLEAVPVASVSGFRVAAVEYALAPEHKFPASIDDVVAVYRTLLESRRPESIGIYGCSAGGMLTAQVVARLIEEGMPVPGAIAMLCGTGLEFDGDSPQAAAAFSAKMDNVDSIRLASLPHFIGADPADRTLFPGEHGEVLEKFPPSLLVTGSRDFAASSVSTMHRRLNAAGVDASLFDFDGMWHAFHMATTLPEAREVFAILSDFFSKHLR